MKLGFRILFLVLYASSVCVSQSEVIQPGANLITDGVPPVPASLAKLLEPYRGYSYVDLIGWDPEGRRIRVLDKGPIIQALGVPLTKGKTIAEIKIESGIVYDFYYDPRGTSLLYNTDAEGDEAYQFYLFDSQTRKSALLTDGKSRNVEPVWSRRGDQVVWGTTPAGATGMELCIINPYKPETRRQLVASSGRPLQAFDWTPDDSKIVYGEFASLRNESSLWIIDVQTGKKTLIASGGSTEKVFYDSAKFSCDGKSVYLITDRDSEFRRIAVFELNSSRFRYLTEDIKWDVESFTLSPDGKRIAFVTNEDGVSKLHFLDTISGKTSTPANLPLGLISKLIWHRNSIDLAFKLETPRTPTDIYSINAETGEVNIWAQADMQKVRTAEIALPDLIHWKSFDGLTLSGFMYRPSAKFAGRRPVVIEIHGGPEEQYRPGFNLDDDLYINELGVVKIYPNVRGSSGYGKTFLALDNGAQRRDALRDIGTLLDWLKTQPDLDPERVMVTGYSYGGYMAMLVAATYGDRLRGAMSDSGPSNLVSFLENTNGWRRDLRRAEYGDERDPCVRAELEKVAPRNNVSKIKTPMLITQGLHDPRVQAGEASEMVEALKKNGVRVWYLLAKDEGHGFTLSENQDFHIYATILFLKQYLLN